MGLVKELLNVVGGCGIRGRLRCAAASIGYPDRIRKRFIHKDVTRLSRDCCQAANFLTLTSRWPSRRRPSDWQ